MRSPPIDPFFQEVVVSMSLSVRNFGSPICIAFVKIWALTKRLIAARTVSLNSVPVTVQPWPRMSETIGKFQDSGGAGH